MGRKCTVCTHAGRSTIDRELLRGVPAGALAQTFGLQARSLVRHRVEHLGMGHLGTTPKRSNPAPAPAPKAAPLPLPLPPVRAVRTLGSDASRWDRQVELLACLEEIQNECRGVIRRAHDDPRLLLMGVDQLRKTLETMARLLQLVGGESSTTNILQVSVGPDVATIKQLVLDVLAGFPEARRAVARQLLAVVPDGGATP